MYNQGIVIPSKQTVGEKIPIFVPILIATLQLILYLAIIGLETASVYYDAGRGTVYAGFWCSTFFLVTWIAMFCYACLKKSSCCGIYLLIQNVLSAIFAIILIVFTAIFIRNPCLCYGILCKVPTWDYSVYNYLNFHYECNERTFQKVPVLKALLACAVLMLVSNLLFIVVYLITSITTRNKPPVVYQIQQPALTTYEPVVVAQPVDKYQQQYLAPAISEPHYYAPTVESAPSAPPIEMRSMRF